MNPRRALVLLAIFSALALSARGLPRLPDPDEPPSFSYTAECHWVIVPASAVPGLVPALSDEKKAAEAWTKVLAMVERGEATLKTSLFATGSGPKLSAESLADEPYPVEVEPIEEAIEASKRPKPPAGAPEEIRWLPTGFDYRSIGSSMELDVAPTADPQVLRCNYVIQHIDLEKTVPTEIGRLPGARPIVIDTPVFAKSNEQSNVYLRSGQPKLLGVHRVPGEANFELLVLTMRVQRPPRPDAAMPTAPWSVSLDLQVVAVPVAEGRRLVPLWRRPESFAAAQERVQTLLEHGDAELLAWPVTHGISGLPIESRAVEEFRYLTEFAWGGIPQLPPPPSLKVNPARIDLYGLYTAFRLPPVFETREAGVSLDAEAKVDPASGGCTLSFVAQRVQLEALAPGLGVNVEHPDTPRVMQPKFSVMKISENMTLANDGRHLVGQFILKKPQPRMVLFLLHATTQPPPRSHP